MQRIASKYGKNFTWEIKVKMMGMPGLKSAQVFVDELKLPITPEAFLQETKKHKKELFPTCNILPGKSLLFSCLEVKSTHTAIFICVKVYDKLFNKLKKLKIIFSFGKI